MSDPAPEIVRVAERSLLVRFGDVDLERAVTRAHGLAARFRRAASGESEESADRRLAVRGEWALGAGNLLVRLDDSCAIGEIDALRSRLDEASRMPSGAESFAVRRAHRFEVRFGGEEGPDLARVAHDVGRSEGTVVELLCAATFTVAFVGFSPGFPYLIGLPEELHVARLDEPRTRVPTGSVAIAGPFAGIYPSSTPGGWRLLGRTGATLFDPAADPPARCTPGDRVRFVAV